MTRNNLKPTSSAPQKQTLRPLNALMQRMFSSRSKPAVATRSVAAEPVPKIKFETLEPRVLLSGDINPGAVTLSGSIDVAGERDQYEFTISDPTRVVFDGLSNNRNLSWNLSRDGESVRSGTFGDADEFVSAWDLQSGKYVLTIDAYGDQTGNYKLRLLDASAAADLTPGTQVSDSLEAANKTALYRFTANAGDKFYFDASQMSGGNATWRLIDPYGKQERNPSSLASDADTFTVQRSGTYLLAIDGDNNNSAPALSYSFNLRAVIDKQLDLALDQETITSIDAIGQQAVYRFTLSQDQMVVLDSRTNDNAFLWSLSGPRGAEFTRRSMFFEGGDDRLLRAGDYTLTIDSAGEKTGSATFKIFTDASLQSLQDNVAVTGVLERSNGMTLYRVPATAGDRLLVAGQSGFTGSATATLFDPYGNAIFGVDVRTNSPIVDAAFTGDYWLAISGSNANGPATAVGYGFTVHRIADTTIPTELGQTITGSISQPGQTAYYTFSLTEPTVLIYDSQTNDNNLALSLDGPRGNEWRNLLLGQAEHSYATSSALLPAGEYRLAVRGDGAQVGSFALRLLDAASATPITVGTTITRALTPGNSTQLFQFIAAPGDRVSFDSLNVSGGSGTWRLIDRFGRQASCARDLANDVATLALDTGGVYTLVVEGGSNNTAPTEVSFALLPAGNEAPAPLPIGIPLAFGSLQSGIVSNGTDQVYRFSLSGNSVLVFDSQAYTYATTWSLVGPRGTEVNQREFAISDNPYASHLALPAGEYALTVKGTGAYAFKLLDSQNLPLLNTGVTTSASLSPGNETDGYRFSATTGDRFQLQVPNGASRGNLKVIDPFGRMVVDQSFYNGAEFATSATGTYVLLYEAPAYASGSVNYTFTLNKQTTTTEPLTLNNATTGEFTAPAQAVAYTFELSEAQIVQFAPQAQASYSTQWKLTGPKGDVFSWRGSADFSGYVGHAFDLPAGRYTLSVKDSSDAVGTFKFQMLTPSAATGLVIDADISGELQSNGVALYRFDATAGERLYFDGQGTYTYPSVQWKLLDPYGRVVKSGNTSSDNGPFSLTANGEYLLAMSAYFDPDAPSVPFSFSLRAATETRSSVMFFKT